MAFMKSFVLLALAACAAGSATDVVVLMDGSGSMARTFGRHPHGFYALSETLRGWVSGAALTGEKALAPAAPAAAGLRVGFVQFSGMNGRRSEAISTPVGVGASGALSGDLGELEGDLNWQETNFLGKGTMLQKGLEVAGDMFGSSPVSRRKVLAVITDGEVFDVQSLAPARKVLDQQGVEVVGIVIRRFSRHTAIDWRAEQTLKPITSEPRADHFHNVVIGDLPSILADL